MASDLIGFDTKRFYASGEAVASGAVVALGASVADGAFVADGAPISFITRAIIVAASALVALAFGWKVPSS